MIDRRYLHPDIHTVSWGVASPGSSLDSVKSWPSRHAGASAPAHDGRGREFPREIAVQIELGNLEVLTPRFVRAARRLNLKIDVWTVNEREDMTRLIALPVDGIITDYPDRMLALRGK
jgi:glycerophosphoryl diester phosphodiesterase